MAAAEAHIQSMAESGVTILRLMLEYCHRDHRYIEKPAGRFNPRMVQLWDDLFALCSRYGIRILLAPWDNFWMALRWHRHPHVLTAGMKRSLASLARFSALVDWRDFAPADIRSSVQARTKSVQVFACGDGTQAVIWLLRGKAFGSGFFRTLPSSDALAFASRVRFPSPQRTRTSENTNMPGIQQGAWVRGDAPMPPPISPLLR